MSRLRVVLVSLALLALAGATAVAAYAATRHGVTPVTPKSGDTVPAGESPTFTVRARGGGEVYVHVCRSKAKRADGLICSMESVGRATRGKRGLYRYTPTFHDFPGFWLNRPGTYYWQAHRIRCEKRRTRDCRQEGPVSSIRVVG
jgi:hypothetical protein